ncbi:MAG: adenylyltransferase/cytidyltransferase family protein [Clostridia bacterium]|nr:adenylyltransferase/cytidyltransferase family protein [Clostridia bacterium]
MKIVDLNHPHRELPVTACGLVLGNFDGVHRGHAALIEELKRQNEKLSTPLALGAFCFERHPSFYFGKPSPLLCSNEEKMEQFRKAGLQFVIWGDFAELKDLSPREFVTEFLWNTCGCRMAVCGFNFTFGKKGAGTPEDLIRLFAEAGDGIVSVVPPVTDEGASVSSTSIRNLLEKGDPAHAARLLGRPFTAECRIVEQSRGEVILAFPANGVIPGDGNYRVQAKIGEDVYESSARVDTSCTLLLPTTVELPSNGNITLAFLTKL